MNHCLYQNCTYIRMITQINVLITAIAFCYSFQAVNLCVICTGNEVNTGTWPYIKCIFKFNSIDMNKWQDKSIFRNTIHNIDSRMQWESCLIIRLPWFSIWNSGGRAETKARKQKENKISPWWPIITLWLRWDDGKLSLVSVEQKQKWRLISSRPAWNPRAGMAHTSRETFDIRLDFFVKPWLIFHWNNFFCWFTSFWYYVFHISKYLILLILIFVRIKLCIQNQLLTNQFCRLHKFM